MKLQRIPQNPILRPRPDIEWESGAVFNAAVVYENELFHLIYRAVKPGNYSSLGYAVSYDGINFFRFDKPILTRETEEEAHGVEDPRITKIGDTFYMNYVTFSGDHTSVALAVSKNLIHWEKKGIIIHHSEFGDNKDAALFPEKINGKYCMFHRPLPDIYICYSDDMIHWTDHKCVMKPIPNSWEERKIGIAGQPLKTEVGWLMIYHGVTWDWVYRLGVAILDLNDPSKVIKRYKDPILEPELEFELQGDVSNVVFSCGNVIVNDTLYVYYGGADTVLCLATIPLKEILNF